MPLTRAKRLPSCVRVPMVTLACNNMTARHQIRPSLLFNKHQKRTPTFVFTDVHLFVNKLPDVGTFFTDLKTSLRTSKAFRSVKEIDVGKKSLTSEIEVVLIVHPAIEAEVNFAKPVGVILELAFKIVEGAPLIIAGVVI